LRHRPTFSRSIIRTLYPLLFLIAQGCAGWLAPPSLERISRYPLPNQPITVCYQSSDASVLPLIEESVSAALPRATLWGKLRLPVTIIVYPNHGALEQAVHKQGYRWLRAWTTEQTIHLQSPRSWLLLNRKRFFELMTHEFTHVVHYQTARLKASRSGRNDPLWFREGLASFTARQGYRRYSRTQLLRELHTHPAFDPLSPTADEIQGEQKLVYSAAHSLVSYLIQKYGEERIRKVLHAIADGNSFAKSFEMTYSMTMRQMQEDWERWLGLAAPASASAHETLSLPR
jgi:hypothetical protein